MNVCARGTQWDESQEAKLKGFKSCTKCNVYTGDGSRICFPKISNFANVWWSVQCPLNSRDTVQHMNEYYEQELDRLHTKLAAIYRLGKLTPAELIAVDGLWARIENLNKTMVKIAARESRQENVGRL